MNIENENQGAEELDDDEKVVQDIVSEFNAGLESEGSDEPKPEPEPEPQEPALEDTDSQAEPEPQDPPDDDDDSATPEPSDDDSIPDDGGDEEDDFDEAAFRKDFAERYGLVESDVSGMPVDQLENFGRALDRKTLNELNAQQQFPQQPPQQQFQPQVPLQPQNQFVPPQQGMPPQQQQVDINGLLRLAEEEGYDPKIIEGLQAAQQQNQFYLQQLQQLNQQRQQQEFEQNQKIINDFDNALDSLGIKSVFGENRQSAQMNQMHWQARENMFNQALQFSQNTGHSLTPDLVKRVASVLYPDQFQNKQQSNIADKARKQHNKKLGSGQSRKPSHKPPKDESAYEGLDPQVPELMADPEIAAFFANVSE